MKQKVTISMLGITVVLALAAISGYAQQPSQPSQPSELSQPDQKLKAQKDIQTAITDLQSKTANLPAEAPTIAWDVIPVKVVSDNYGKNVSNKYIAIDVLIHNNDPTQQLMVQGFAFGVKCAQKTADGKDQPCNEATQTAPCSDDAKKKCVQYVSNDPALVRGTIQKTQMVGFRNRAVQTIKTAGLIATGAEGYIHAVNASANFNRGVSIFSNPFEKGIELIFPDTTVTYLGNWDSNQVFKSGFIVDPGKEIRGRVFLGLEIVCSSKFPSPPANGENCKQGGFWSGAAYDPNQIKLRLGAISAIGNSAAIATGQKIQPPKQ